MAELYELWETADSWDDLPEVPDFDEFEECDRIVDVGYDCYFSTAYVYGPYAILYDNEKYGNDLWGWSAEISYMDGNRSTYSMPCHKCASAQEAYDKLAEYLNDI